MNVSVAGFPDGTCAVEDRIRLADLLAGLSLISDLGLGLPPDDAVRTCLLGVGLARELDLDDAAVATVFYTSLLQHVGCTGYAHESYLVWGDDLAANRAAQRTNLAQPADLFRSYLPTLTAGMNPGRRARVAKGFVTGGPSFSKRFTTATCEVAVVTSRRVGLPHSVLDALHQVFEWWNGKGAPQGLAGEDIALAGRIAHLAGVASKFDRLGGPRAAVSAVDQRAGTILDPDLVEVFRANAVELLRSGGEADPRQRLLDAEPRPVRLVEHHGWVEVAAAFGDIADLKNPYFHGHSAGVARICRAAGERLGLDTASSKELHLAALLHDVGRIGISNAVWEKSGPLSRSDREQVRLHAYHTERVLACSPSLGSVAQIAGMHHERLDGSGYHRGCAAAQIGFPGRILAVADSLHAMTQPRPHRAALSLDEAAGQIHQEVRAGRLDLDAATSVLDVVDAALPLDAGPRPAGLTVREVQVLEQLARGLSNRAIAKRLHISPRTAELHVQHIYAKIGSSSRAAAALFAMEHGLLLGR